MTIAALRTTRTLLATLLLAFGLTALAQDDGQAAQGQEIYQNRCATCHGPEGEGGIGPAHAGNQNLQNTEQMVNIVLNGKGEMPAFGGQLSHEQIAAVLTFLRTSWDNDFGAVTPEQVAQVAQQGEEGDQQEGDGSQNGGQDDQDQDGQDGQDAQEGGQASGSQGDTEGTIATNHEGVALKTLAGGLVSPVQLVSPPGDDRRFVIDRPGLAYQLDDSGQLMDEPFLDIRDRVVELRENFDERGLLGIAFHPDFVDNGRVYVYYSAPLREEAPDNWDHTTHVSEFLTMEPEDDAQPRGSTNRIDPNSERILLKVDQPQFNHNAGALDFGPDGYLYIALGDGGAADDVALGHPPMGHGQDITSMLGSILRIDVDRGWPGYAVPQDNPLVGQQGVDEAHSWGWRNPWRMSFDKSGNGKLYVATNGQNLWEAVYEASEPGNYAWNILEGTHCFDPQNPDDPPAECADTGPQGEPLKLPVIEYPHVANQGDAPVAGNSVIGGYLYRGEAIPALQGKYVFGDWSKEFTSPQGQLLVATPSETEGELWALEQLALLDKFVLGFGQDSQGELYVLTTDNTGPAGTTGQIHQLVPSGGN